MGRAAMVLVISKYVEIFGRLTIAAIVTGCAFAAMDGIDYYEERISSPIVPGFIIFCIAYLIGALFMLVYEGLLTPPSLVSPVYYI